MAPWKERISALTDKILEVDADVICLQEVHTEDSCFSLYDKLKERYIHFYVAIGPRPLGFSLKTLGLPNGLFVASKYPVQHPSFTPFSVTGYQMNYGIFDFVIANDSTPLGHIYTTHMQSLNENGFDEIREKEFLQLIEKIQSEFQSDFDLNLPHLVCGSLNIAWGSEEPGETLIHHYFYDAYNHGRSAVIAEESTCTNYFSEFCLTFADYPEAIDENARILDYALLYQPLPGYSVRPLCKRCSLKTVLVPMHSIDKPESAISNHHGLLSTIKRAKDRQHSNPNLPPVLH
jgi:endonuclease/exonuclease/phosphatase family metal-dependent hydrolase